MTDHFPNESGAEMTPQRMPPTASLPRPASPGGYAIAAFVLGILAFVTCGPCAGIPAFILGMIELRHIKERASPVEGRPFALAGAIMGGINSALAILVILFYAGFILFAVLAHGTFGLQ